MCEFNLHTRFASRAQRVEVCNFNSRTTRSAIGARLERNELNDTRVA